MPDTTTLADFKAELESVCAAAVLLPAPPAGTTNIFTAIQVIEKSFVEQLRETAPRISLPALIFDIGEMTECNDFGMMTVGLMYATVRIFYVDQWGVSASRGTQAAVDAMAVAIKLALESPTAQFAYFTVSQGGAMSSGMSNPLNQTLFGESQAKAVSASVAYTQGFMVQDYTL